MVAQAQSYYNRRRDVVSHENFITSVLNLKSSDLLSVDSVTTTDGSLKLRVKLVHKQALCPVCSTPSRIHGYYTRKLMHSTLSNRKCVICYSQRRYICPECGTTFSEANPFIDSSERITYETKINVLKDLKHPEATYATVAQHYNLTPTKVTRIFDKHVDIPRKPLTRVISIDEHYFPNSDREGKYCCLLMDFVTGVILDVLPDRRKTYLDKYFSEIKSSSMNYMANKSELDIVEYISIDMYEPYRDIAAIFFPRALVCADSFHVLKHLTDAFRKVVRRLMRETPDPKLRYLLVKFHHVFDHNKMLDNPPRYNKVWNRFMNYRVIMEILFAAFDELKTAYELKEYYINLNANTKPEDAPKAISEAIGLFESCGISEYEDFYKMLENWRKEIINSFTMVNGRRINNSHIESKNRIVDKLFFNANGFRNFDRARNRILYCLNADDLFKL